MTSATSIRPSGLTVPASPMETFLKRKGDGIAPVSLGSSQCRRLGVLRGRRGLGNRGLPRRGREGACVHDLGPRQGTQLVRLAHVQMVNQEAQLPVIVGDREGQEPD